MKKAIHTILPRHLLLTLITLLFSLSSSFATEVETPENEDVFEVFCPPTKWVDCTDEIWDLSWLGNAWYKDYTGTHDAGHPEVKFYLNDCNIGYITRTWKIRDYHGYWHKCTQKINVGGNYFNSSSIKWPKNIALTGCNPNTDPKHLPSGKNMPTWSTYGATCSKIGYSYQDNKFVYGPGCYEIIRTWSIVDCCDFNPWTNKGIWTYNQRITVTTADNEPNVWVPYDVTAETINCEKAQVDIPVVEVKDGCDEQYIITNNSPYAYSDGADASGKYPVGTTKVRFMVKYNCWETKFFYLNVTVKDESVPVPYCYYGLSVSLMGVDNDGDGIFDDGMREIWASEFNAGSYYPCNANTPLQFSFSSDPKDNVRIFTCEDVGQQEVDMWVTTYDGKQEYCTTYIKLQNNGANIPNCDPLEDALITGNISSVYNNTDALILDVNSSYEGMTFDTSYTNQTAISIVDSSVNDDGSISYDYGIEEVSVAAVDTTPIDKDFIIDVTEGEYLLENLDLNEDYILTLSNTNETMEFIDSMDVHMFRAYLDGTLEMNMYQKLAADLNHDMMVDAADLEILEAFVAGANTDSVFEWVTLDPEFKMPTNISTDIDAYPTSKMVEVKNRNAIGVDLMIFQMGDLTDKDNLEDLLGTKEVSLRNTPAFLFQGVSPNPFNLETQFSFENNKNQKVTIEIFSLSGQMIQSATKEMMKGSQTISIGSAVIEASGVYLYNLKTEGFSHQGKLIKVN